MAAEKGILMRSADAFQGFGRIDRMVLDKTGTLTKGEPRVVAVVAVPGVDRSEVLRLAAAVEVPSEHPLAQAIRQRAEHEGIEPPPVTDFDSLTGRGVRGRVNGRLVTLGRPGLATEFGADLAPLAGRIEELEAQARTVVVVVADRVLFGAVAIADPVKPDAAATVAELLLRGIEPVMLTGDNERTARAVAERVGIGEIRAQVLPEDKAARVRELQQDGHRVAMVGDGINDAPALMQADIGIAIGAGTDIAIESSDVILVGERLSAVVDAWEVGRGSYRRTKQNLAIAFAFNGIGVPAASTGLVHPVWAMAAMATSVTMVLLNSFGLRVFSRSSYRRFADPAQLRGEHGYHDETDEAPAITTEELEAEAVEPAAAGHATRLTMHVTGVHCGSCMERAAAGVADLEGVIEARPLPRLGDLSVEYLAAKAHPAAVAERLEQLGFGTRDEELAP